MGILTLKRNPRKRVLFRGRDISLGILILLVKLLALRVIARRILLQNMPCVPSMLNFLNTNNRQLSIFDPSLTPSGTYLFVEILAIDVSQGTLTHELGIGMHFVTAVRRRHNRVVRAVVCKSVNIELLQ